MSTRATDRLLDLQEEHFSRRGFLAKLGGVAAGLGLVMAGAGMMPRRVMAAHGCCANKCPAGCPPTIGCPTNCTVNGAPTVCCDTGHIGATETIHLCQQCTNCLVGGGPCFCEYDTGNACP